VFDITAPQCGYASSRADGKASHVKVIRPDHPIAKDLPATFDIPHTVMWNEPFHIPEPDVVIFEEKWDTGEHFRSGCLWNVGRAEYLGFNSVRVFVQYWVWKEDPSGFKARFENFLATAARHKLTVVPVLFDDSNYAGKDPYLGKQDEPIKGVRTSGWTGSPGA